MANQVNSIRLKFDYGAQRPQDLLDIKLVKSGGAFTMLPFNLMEIDNDNKTDDKRNRLDFLMA